MPRCRSSHTKLRMFLALLCPGPALVWPALAMALVESEWITMWRWLTVLEWNYEMACSMDATSASKAVSWPLRLRAP
jgi:hypothetical protein